MSEQKLCSTGPDRENLIWGLTYGDRIREPHYVIFMVNSVMYNALIHGLTRRRATQGNPELWKVEATFWKSSTAERSTGIGAVVKQYNPKTGTGDVFFSNA
jgi:hypothetical protein